MVELENKSSSHTISPGSPYYYRQVAATLEGNAESASDRDGTTDDEIEQLDAFRGPGEASNIIDISISQTQTLMKSPHTPAFEKVKALDESRSYFGVDPSTEDVEDDSSSHSPKQGAQDGGSKSRMTTSSPQILQDQRHPSTSTTPPSIGSDQNDNRKRSESGSATILDSFRKMINDFPSYSGFGSNTRRENDSNTATLDGQQVDSNGKARSNRPTSLVQPRTQQPHTTGLDGSVLSNEQSDSRPKPLRRVTSDNSLYLRRATTGASEFDNTTAYSNVGDMPNARFKAITDSLADSSFKRPKMPSISLGSSKNSTSRLNSELTQRNTAFNTGNPRSSTMSGLGGSDQALPPADPVTSKKHPILSEALSVATGDIVFMGGYRGSVLRSAEPPYHQLWVPVKVGLNLRKADLEVGLTREDEERSEEKIIPSGMLSHIGPIDLARRLLKKVRKCPNARLNRLRVHDWGYDWRLSPHLLSQKLIKLLESLECNHPETPPEKRGAIIVAHSLGGLVTRHAVNQRPELFAGVVYGGTPQNCCNILGPLRNGDDVLLSSKVLTAQVNFTLRTSYALLPEDGRCFLNKDTGERYDVDFFDVNTWDEYRLSPCINAALPAFTQQPRKSMIGSISESISSLTPSFSSKRSSWFSNSNNTMGETSNSDSTLSPTRDTVTEKAQDIQDTLGNAAHAATEGIQSSKQEGQNSLEPSMKPTSNKSSAATTVTIPKDKAREYLSRTLADVKQFKSELRHVPSHQDGNRYPPHAIIFGKSVPTVYGAKVASREAIKCADAYDELAFAAGDGVVLASAAQLPSGYRCVKGGRVQTDRGHVGLLGDLEGVGQCIAAVVEGRKKGIGMGNYQ